jgi:hypothetical protein
MAAVWRRSATIVLVDRSGQSVELTIPSLADLGDS